MTFARIQTTQQTLNKLKQICRIKDLRLHEAVAEAFTEYIDAWEMLHGDLDGSIEVVLPTGPRPRVKEEPTHAVINMAKHSGIEYDQIEVPVLVFTILKEISKGRNCSLQDLIWKETRHNKYGKYSPVEHKQIKDRVFPQIERIYEFLEREGYGFDR